MNRFWIGWVSGGYVDEGCVIDPPFQYWWTGQRERPNYGLTPEQYVEYSKIDDEDGQYEFLDEHSKSDGTAVALVEANNEDEVWVAIAKYFPDFEIRFCEECEVDYNPGSRFGGFENKVSLYEQETDKETN